MELRDTLRRLIASRPEDRIADANAALKELAAALRIPVPIETAATRESFLQATELIGRDAELRQLSTALIQAKSGQGSAYLIGGESGIGKSRLLVELRTQSLVSGLWVVEGQSVAEDGLYFQEVLPLMRALCVQIDLTDSEAAVLKPFVPDISALLGRTIPDAKTSTADDVQRRLFQTLNELLHRLRKPLLLLLEDLHWSRRETLAWLEHLLPNLSHLPILLIGTFRSDEEPELKTRFPIAHYMPLCRLSGQEISRLSESMLGPDGRDVRLVSYLERQTEGNVFFLIEIMRTLGENAGELQRIHQSELPEQVLTAGIERIVERRIDRVQAMHRPALELAATYGRKLNLMMMQRAFPDLSIPHFLFECANAAVLESQANDWQFAHDKLRESVLRRLTADGKRQPLHRRIAETLEGLYASASRDKPSEAASAMEFPSSGTAVLPSGALLGYHFRQAGLLEKALYYYQQAGDHAAKLCLYEEALLHYESVCEILLSLPSTPSLRRQHVDVLLKQIQYSIYTILPTVNLQRAIQAQQIIEALKSEGAEEPRDRLRQAYLDNEAGRIYVYLGQHMRAAECFERAIPVMQEFQDQEFAMFSSLIYGWMLLTHGHIRRAINALSPSISAIEHKLGIDIQTLRAYSFLALAFALSGQGRAALNLLEHARRWLDEVQQPTFTMLYYLNFSSVLLFSGDFPAALRFNDAAIESSKKCNAITMEYLLLDSRSWIFKARGDFEAALRYRLQASELHARVGGLYVQDYVIAGHADILLHLGRPEEAIELAEKSTRLARAAGSVFGLPIAERVWGCALARQGLDPATVDAHLRESLRIATEAGNIWEAIQSEIAWGQICCARQDTAAASAHFQGARDHVTDDMLPCARELYHSIIEQGLQKCKTYT